MEFLIIVWAITAGACWLVSLKAAYHYGRAKQAKEIRRKMKRWKAFRRDEVEKPKKPES